MDKRVSKDPGSLPPSEDQVHPAIAYGSGHALAVWQDVGHHDPDSDSGIWGRFWVPTERVVLPLVLRAWE